MRDLRILSLLFQLCMISLTLQAQSRVGQPVPSLALSKVLQGERQLPRAGHPLLIEIWATWCGPCTASIPHINELERQFGTKGMDFLWLSEDDPSDKVVAFLRSHPMLGTVAIDDGAKRNLLFGQEGLPTTVLIDSTGHVAAISRSADLKAGTLQELLDHKPLSLSPAETDYHLAESHWLFQGSAGPDQDAVLRVVIRRTASPGGLMNAEGTWRTNGGVSLRSLFAKAYGFHDSQVGIPDYLNQLYDVQDWGPSATAELMRPVIQAALAASASVQVRHVRRSMKVLVLHGLEHLPAARRGGTIEVNQQTPNVPNQLTYDSISANQIVEMLQSELPERPVVLDKPVPGWFVFRLQRDSKQPKVLTESLESQGLRLREETRLVDCIVVEDAVPLRNLQ